MCVTQYTARAVVCKNSSYQTFDNIFALSFSSCMSCWSIWCPRLVNLVNTFVFVFVFIFVFVFVNYLHVLLVDVVS